MRADWRSILELMCVCFGRSVTRSDKATLQTSNHAVYLEEGSKTLRDFGRVVAGVK